MLAGQQEWVAKAEARPDEWFREQWYEVLGQVRARLAAYLGAEDEDEVVLVENASSGINALLRSLPLSGGDRVLYFNTAYRMVHYTLQVGRYQGKRGPHPQAGRHSIERRRPAAAVPACAGLPQ